MAPKNPSFEFTVAAADRSPLGRTRSLAGGVMNTVRLSRALVDGQRQVDLAGLDNVVGLLCAKALDLAPEIGRMLIPELYAVLEEVQVLTEAIRAAQAAPATP